MAAHTRLQTHARLTALFRDTQVSRYQKGKTNLDFIEARDSEWQWHQLGHMQVSTFLQTDNHTSTPPVSFLQAGCPSCRPTNSVKALKAQVFLKAEHRPVYLLLHSQGNMDLQRRHHESRWGQLPTEPCLGQAVTDKDLRAEVETLMINAITLVLL